MLCRSPSGPPGVLHKDSDISFGETVLIADILPFFQGIWCSLKLVSSLPPTPSYLVSIQTPLFVGSVQITSSQHPPSNTFLGFPSIIRATLSTGP